MKLPSSRPPATPTVQAFRSVLEGTAEAGAFSDRGRLSLAAGLPCCEVLKAAVDPPLWGASWAEQGCKDRPNRTSPKRQPLMYFKKQPRSALQAGVVGYTSFSDSEQELQ